MWIGKTLHVAIQLHPELIDVALCMRNIVTQVELAPFGLANPLDVQLEEFFVPANLPANLNHVAVDELASVGRFPHARL